MIAAAIWFNSGILVFADGEPASPGRRRAGSGRIFPRRYPAGAQSVFVRSDPDEHNIDTFRHCEEALAKLTPTELTIDRMRATIEETASNWSTGDAHGQHQWFVVIYAPCDLAYALFRANGATLSEITGYDCEGTAAHLGHYLIRDRYNAARSMDSLDLTTVFAIAVDALDGIRAAHDGCGESSELAVLYADGHVSDVKRIPHGTRQERNVALMGLART